MGPEGETPSVSCVPLAASRCSAEGSVRPQGQQPGARGPWCADPAWGIQTPPGRQLLRGLARSGGRSLCEVPWGLGGAEGGGGEVPSRGAQAPQSFTCALLQWLDGEGHGFLIFSPLCLGHC